MNFKEDIRIKESITHNLLYDDVFFLISCLF